MILHLFHDEKIINRMIDNFEEVLPGQNVYVCFVPKTDYSFIHLSNNDSRIIKYKDGDIFNHNTSKITKVFIHYLTLEKIRFCERFISTSTTIYWGLWGGDLYNYLLFSKGYKLYSSINYKYNIRETIVDILNLVKYRLFDSNIYINFINNRVAYIGGVNCDFDLVKKYILKYPKKHFNIPGYGIDEILGPVLIRSKVQKKSNVILCANSASYTNNHRYVINVLSKLIGTESIVKMVLSYAGDKNYIKKIANYGKKVLGDQFCPITNFLPLNDYNNLQCSAQICIYGSWRQEALGNILVSLYLGAKVYLSKYSPLLNELRSVGYTVFVLEEATKESFYRRINYTDQVENRSLVITNNNKQIILESIEKHFSD